MTALSVDGNTSNICDTIYNLCMTGPDIWWFRENRKNDYDEIGKEKELSYTIGYWGEWEIRDAFWA